MSTTTTRRTKEMLLEELEAKNVEIKELKKEIEKAERLKQFEDAASELSAYRDSIVKAGFTKAEANDLIKVLLANSVKQFAR